MPANLTPQYRKAQDRYRAAADPREQLEALREMLRIIPKHKGTEHLQADIKRRIKQANEEAQSGKKKRRGPSYSIDSAGHPQVVLLGPPNGGKSALVRALTGTEQDVAPYPYTTHEPRPAMMPFENTRVQLVDMPPIFPDHMEAWITTIARAGDAVLLVVDLGADDLLEATEAVLRQIGGHKLFLDEIPEAQDEFVGATAKRTIVAANKCDLDDGTVLDLFREAYGRFRIVPVSAESGEGLEELRQRIWERLDLVRAVPKPPGKPPDDKGPILLPRGSTVVDMARVIHRDLVGTLRRARIWRSPGHAEGTWVSRTHVVQDGEVFELDT